VIDATGTDERPLTETPVEDENGPAWSPDGSRIVFRWGSELNAPSDIRVMNADGSGQEPLTSDPSKEVGPAWSPDGSTIAFRRADHIYVMNADGTAQHPLTSSEDPDALGLLLETAPEWSPDASMVTFEGASSREAPTDIYRIDSDGTNLRRLTSTPEWEFAPSW
jgi:TolB protein